jgi:hypothetical protein
MYCHVQSRAHATPGAIVQYETAARQIAEKLERDLSIQSVGDWYTKLTRKAIKAHEGGTFHRWSFFALLSTTGHHIESKLN